MSTAEERACYARRVLVVDDDASTRALLRCALQDEDIEVLEAGNGAEALSALAAVVPHAIILDLSMPVMDGSTFYRLLRANGHPSIPVLILSAADARRVQRELGAEASVTKPFDVDHVIAELGQLIPRP